MGSGMRALKVATIVMGVLIVVGTTVLIGTIAHRVAAPPPASLPAASLALMLDEPAGTHIAGIAAAGDRLAVQLQGGGGDRIVLLDPRTGSVVGRISLAR